MVSQVHDNRPRDPEAEARAAGVLDVTLPFSEIDLDPDENLGRKTRVRVAPPWLVASIREHGHLDPLVVTRKADGRYLVVAGESRYLALRELGVAVVRCSLRLYGSNGQLRLAAMASNAHRESLSLGEQTWLIGKMLKSKDVTVDEVVRKLPHLKRHTVLSMERACNLFSAEQLEKLAAAPDETVHLLLGAAEQRDGPKREMAILEAFARSIATRRTQRVAKGRTAKKIESYLYKVEETPAASLQYRGTPLNDREKALVADTARWTAGHAEFPLMVGEGKRLHVPSQRREPNAATRNVFGGHVRTGPSRGFSKKKGSP